MVNWVKLDRQRLVEISIMMYKIVNSIFQIILVRTLQGSYRSWKTWKVMEFYNFNFQAWKVLKFRCGSWKVMENQYVFHE